MDLLADFLEGKQIGKVGRFFQLVVTLSSPQTFL